MTRLVRSVPWTEGWEADSWSPVPPEIAWARFGSGEQGEGVHGFVEDWRLEALARGNLGSVGKGRAWAIEPDFSVCQGMPEVVQRWQTYRSRYCGDLLRAVGLQVVPVMTWSGKEPVAWCAWGVKPGSCVAVRAPGPASAERAAWQWGYYDALDLLQPAFVLVFGLVGRVRGVLDGAGVPWRQEALRRSQARRPVIASAASCVAAAPLPLDGPGGAVQEEGNLLDGSRVSASPPAVELPAGSQPVVEQIPKRSRRGCDEKGSKANRQSAEEAAVPSTRLTTLSTGSVRWVDPENARQSHSEGEPVPRWMAVKMEEQGFDPQNEGDIHRFCSLFLMFDGVRKERRRRSPAKTVQSGSPNVT